MARPAKDVIPLTEEQRREVESRVGYAVRLAARKASLMPKDDRIQHAVLGLIDAVQRRNPFARPGEFGKYIRARVLGEMNDAERSWPTGVIRVSRYGQRKVKRGEARVARLDELIDENGDEWEPVCPEPDDPAIAPDALANALSKLRPESRYAIYRYYFRGEPLHLIARRIGLSESGVHRNISQAIQSLKTDPGLMEAAEMSLRPSRRKEAS